MGAYVPTRFPRSCRDCSELCFNVVVECYPDEYGEDSHGNKIVCPLIEIDLVRCGECKWYNPWHANHTNIDGNHCRNIDRPMKPTDFCSYGERRAE